MHTLKTAMLTGALILGLSSPGFCGEKYSSGERLSLYINDLPICLRNVSHVEPISPTYTPFVVNTWTSCSGKLDYIAKYGSESPHYQEMLRKITDAFLEGRRYRSAFESAKRVTDEQLRFGYATSLIMFEPRLAQSLYLTLSPENATLGVSEFRARKQFHNAKQLENRIANKFTVGLTSKSGE